VRDYQNDVSWNFLQAKIQRRTEPDVSINMDLARAAEVFCRAFVSTPPYGVWKEAFTVACLSN
jgi:hypothetical protein